jgi:ABC-type Fe3+ transport system substrate-binding protein
MTRFDVSIQNLFRTGFLSSDFAIQNNIVDIVWTTPAPEFWDDVIKLGNVDVCWGGGTNLFNQLASYGFLEPLTGVACEEIVDKINQTQMKDLLLHYDESELLWIGSSISSFGVTVNTDFLETYSLDTPQNWTDLGNVSYAQYLLTIPTIAMANAPDSTSNCQIYQIILQSLGWEAGWELLSRMAGSANIYGGSVETQAACENGDVGVSMSIDFYGYNSQNANSDCQYIIPSDGAHLDCEPIAVANSSSDVNLAMGFIDFVMSSYGQSLFLDDSIRRLPSLPDAFQEPLGMAALDMYMAYNNTLELTPIDFNNSQSISIQNSVAYYFEAVLTNAHVELVNCWHQLVTAYLDSNITIGEFQYLAALMSAPVTIEDPYSLENETFSLDYALSINEALAVDYSYRNDVMTAWTSAAISQYAEVISYL